MPVDYHLHSQFSGDSKTTLEAICHTAVERGIAEIAITDHMDYSYPDMRPDHQIANIDDYFDTIAHYQERYKGVLTIRAGIEIGMEPHHLDSCDAFLKQYPFDFVIGSIHECCGLPVSRAVYFENKTKEQAYETYYSAILECVKAFDNFDVIGHLDYCKRYYPGEYTSGDHFIAQPIVEELFRTLIAKGKGIEVNTSGFRHVSEMCMPHYDILALYRQMGGTRITIGSDSHVAEYVGFHSEDTAERLKQLGFDHISTFEQRVEKKLSL
mgnify:FL=1